MKTESYKAGFAEARAAAKGGKRRISDDTLRYGPWGGETLSAAKQEANRQWLAGWKDGSAS